MWGCVTTHSCLYPEVECKKNGSKHAQKLVKTGEVKEYGVSIPYSPVSSCWTDTLPNASIGKLPGACADR